MYMFVLPSPTWQLLLSDAMDLCCPECKRFVRFDTQPQSQVDCLACCKKTVGTRNPVMSVAVRWLKKPFVTLKEICHSFWIMQVLCSAVGFTFRFRDKWSDVLLLVIVTHWRCKKPEHIVHVYFWKHWLLSNAQSMQIRIRAKSLKLSVLYCAASRHHCH